MYHKTKMLDALLGRSPNHLYQIFVPHNRWKFWNIPIQPIDVSTGSHNGNFRIYPYNLLLSPLGLMMEFLKYHPYNLLLSPLGLTV
jgi:hypothetical protein